MKKVYVAITGDIVESRFLRQRDEVQEKLRKILENINKKFKECIVVKFCFTLGDEFQGLVNSLEKSYAIVSEIQKLIFPVRIYFGVGMGNISTKIYSRTSEMDGECFFRSRAALNEAKKINQSVVYNTQTEFDLAINTIIKLIDVIKKDWKSIHYKRIHLYQQFGTIEKVARIEKVTKQSISKMFKDIKFNEVRSAEENIKKMLSTIKS